MKLLEKGLLILVLVVCIVGIIPKSTSFASNQTDRVMSKVIPEEPAPATYSNIQKIIGRILFILRIASGLVSVVVIAFTGFNYIISTPDVKHEIKRKMLPIIIGLVLIFSAVSIAQFVLEAVVYTNIEPGTGSV